MKLDYDIEVNILEDIHELDSNECFIFSDEQGSDNYLATAKILDDILGDACFKKWKDNSKSQFPPDLINEDDSLMMEVMRIDDHSPDGKKNPNLSRQRTMRREIDSMKEMFPNAKRFIMNSVTDLPTEEDHNYKYYYSSFQRAVRKHLSKLDEYKKNHSGKKMIFLVADETSGVYFEANNKKNEAVYCKLHFVFLDKRFINEFINSKLDYLILYCPYNNVNSFVDHEPLPHLTIFDVKNMKNNKNIILCDYDEDKMFSSEK